jgi:hydroxymethylpyrimidine pyrophosphatase-like HAD family hydrolase
LSNPLCLRLTSAAPHLGLPCPPQVKVIVSGVGDWRYVDVTSARAGKLAALEYVRQLYGVHHARCVAAGDSGNDTLMLGGRNLAIGEGGGSLL